MIKHLLSLLTYLFIICFHGLIASEYSIVFIHIGDKIPAYAEDALIQARAFNEDCPIILVANEKALSHFKCKDSKTNITYVACETLNKSIEHQQFIKNSTLDGRWREGFWRYTSERFLYLYDLINDFALTNVFHLEYDNMLYVNLADLLPIFMKAYKGIAATFDNDQRCIPGFVYISNKKTMRRLASCFAKYADKGYNDMKLIAIFKNESSPDSINHLPIIHREYAEKYPLTSQAGHRAQNNDAYSLNIEHFQSIFDAAALGQYLGGIDPSNGPSKPGFVNESCLFNPSKLSFSWEIDERGRKVPYATFAGTTYRINNLHIHSKKLDLYSSR